VFAEAPGKTEAELGVPLCGPSGNETIKAFQVVGWSRRNLVLGNICACRPPGNDMKAHLLLLGRRNKSRERKGKDPILTPMEACWPRMLRELHTLDNVLLMGAYSRAAVYSHRIVPEDEQVVGRAKKDASDTALQAARGYPDWVIIPGIPELGLAPKTIGVVSTVHPAYVMRQRRWTFPFRWDVAKSVRQATNNLSILEPAIVLNPTVEQIGNFLERLDGTPAYDIETNGQGDWNAEQDIRCIGIGNESQTIVIPYKSVQRYPEWRYTPAEREQRNEIVNAWFRGDIGADPHKIACDQNGQFDLCVLRHQHPGFVMGRKRFDTAIAHHVAHSEFPHDLGFLTSQYTDRPAHKDVDHHSWTSDRELHIYNAYDVATTSWAAQCLVLEPDLQAQKVVFENDMFLSQFCLEMHELGLHMDIVERDSHYKRLTDSAEVNLAQARDYAVQAVNEDSWTKAREKFAVDINPNSPQQMQYFLYEMMGVAPLPAKEGGFTDSGEPSVSKDILFSLMDKGLSDTLERFLLAVIDYREDIKLRSTYCEVEPCSDGRIHPNWNPHTVLSGRLSCSEPNVQNLKKILRTIYDCEKGHILVAWDYAQLEARIVAWLAQQMDQVDAFLSGADIHRVNACAVLGIDSVDKVAKGERQFTKTFVYAAQYLAGVEKVWQMLRNFRALDGTRPYRDMPFKQVKTMFDRFWRQRADIMRYHETGRALQYDQGFLAEPVMGRLRRFLDAIGINDEKEEKANFRIQACGAAIINSRTKVLREHCYPGFDGPNTGIVQQGHDSLMVECREENAEKVGLLGIEKLFFQLGGLPIPVDCEIGYSFGRLREMKEKNGRLVPK
jgi:DNA polymerase I-like protein with 3'-5' exonuclease and polymerase domains/uracil-DNA glycosylase